MPGDRDLEECQAAGDLKPRPRSASISSASSVGTVDCAMASSMIVDAIEHSQCSVDEHLDDRGAVLLQRHREVDASNVERLVEAGVESGDGVPSRSMNRSSRLGRRWR